MDNDTNATQTLTETDSPGNDDTLYSDWLTSAGSTIEITINTIVWPTSLVESFRKSAVLILDDILSEFDNTTAIISLFLCDDAQMKQLNYQHRQIDKPTNVLSFPAYDAGEHKIDRLVPVLIGDIVIAGETAVQEAHSMQIPVADHLLHLFVHGALHLFGYDHIDDDLAQAMEALEVKFLANAGVPNPYQDVQMEIRN